MFLSLLNTFSLNVFLMKKRGILNFFLCGQSILVSIPGYDMNMFWRSTSYTKVFFYQVYIQFNLSYPNQLSGLFLRHSGRSLHLNASVCLLQEYSTVTTKNYSLVFNTRLYAVTYVREMIFQQIYPIFAYVRFQNMY